MRSLSKSMALAVAATGLVIAPVAAQAGTRAESAPVSIDVQRAGAPTADESALGLANPLYLILILAAVAAAVAAAAGRSRG